MEWYCWLAVYWLLSAAVAIALEKRNTGKIIVGDLILWPILGGVALPIYLLDRYGQGIMKSRWFNREIF